ncbi:DUF5104 domain-containing protein [Cellulosilyticum sp. WCF-2]|uniref:DUF5104 domain-containing protein n=1 Tax=Cellulosilyticum sp. WCF-2 TaxID=2497860 RepID=UPI000F8C8274|nr:DUF5104 domain-containing protein [Cellulosilyticum sp. WCF-2]QEH69888.1 DUF5104 domain-containing protein [Cellulosilyticum sp. WCF-2]
MKKIKWHIISGKNIIRNVKLIILGTGVCVMVGSIMGCNFRSRLDYLAESNRTDDEQSEATRQSIIDALEAQDAQGLKALFSKYALENAEDLDEKIEELMDFYPGCNGGFDGGCSTLEGTDYGVRTKVLNGTYTVTNDNQEYYLIFTIQIRNDEEPEKVGLHLIEVVTEETMPEGFKFKNQKDTPGIYVLE